MNNSFISSYQYLCLFVAKTLLRCWIVIWSSGGLAEGEREAGTLLSREPNVVLCPKTLRSRPKLKADPYQLSHPGTPKTTFYSKYDGTLHHFGFSEEETIVGKIRNQEMTNGPGEKWIGIS